MNIAIVGAMGNGKTILGTEFCYRGMMRGMTVYANYHMDGCEYYDYAMQIRQLDNAMVVIDDSIGVADSRQSSSNIDITHVVMASRKKGLDILRTFQVDTGDDLRLRETTNIIFKPYLIKFPMFGCEIFYPDGRFFDDFTIKFCKEVQDMYNHREVAYQKIRKSDIMLLRKDLPTNNVFSRVMSIRYGLQKTICDAVATLLPYQAWNYISEVLMRGGFVLLDE